MRACRLLFLMLFLNSISWGAFAQTDTGVTEQRAVELRGTVTAERAWWDLRRYDLKIKVDRSVIDGE